MSGEFTIYVSRFNAQEAILTRRRWRIGMDGTMVVSESQAASISIVSKQEVSLLCRKWSF
jgi:hypothetical protein